MNKWFISGQRRHAHINETKDSIRTKLTHLKIILSFTLKVSIAYNKRKCTKKWTNGLSVDQGRHTHNKTTKVNICTNLTHLNIMLSNSFIFKVSIASNKKKCTKNKQMVLFLGEKDTPTTKQLMLVFALTWYMWISYCQLHSKSQ